MKDVLMIAFFLTPLWLVVIAGVMDTPEDFDPRDWEK